MWSIDGPKNNQSMIDIMNGSINFRPISDELHITDVYFFSPSAMTFRQNPSVMPIMYVGLCGSAYEDTFIHKSAGALQYDFIEICGYVLDWSLSFVGMCFQDVLAWMCGCGSSL